MDSKVTRCDRAIHAYLKSLTKLYCDCSAEISKAEPNTLICPICISLPGSKPMGVNKKALESIIKIGLALDCEILTDKPIYIQRKNYFYPDLPNNYQRTSKPIAVQGSLDKAEIWEVHLEEDPGRYDLKEGTVDYNRSGLPLAEIITGPSFSKPKEARRFMQKLRIILEYLDVLKDLPAPVKVDANISLAGGQRVEVKNINSFKGIEKALNFEIIRQTKLIEVGKAVQMETRHYDENQMITVGLREKETVADYRYFPDPDVPPLVIDPGWVKELRKEIPELPHQKQKRFVEEYGLNPKIAKALVADLDLANFFEQVAKEIEPKGAATWVKDRLKKVLNYYKLELSETELKPKHLIQLLNLLENQMITHRSARKILRELVKKPRSPKKIAEERSLIRIKDKKFIRNAVEQVVKEHKKAVRDYKAGKEEAFHFLVGKIMKKVKGRADPKTVRKILLEKL